MYNDVEPLEEITSAPTSARGVTFSPTDDVDEVYDFYYDEEEDEEEEEEVEEEEHAESNVSFSDISSVCSNSSANKTGWTKFGTEPDSWADDKHPVVKMFQYEDLILTDDEENGILTDRIVYACSSVLDKNPESHNYTLSKVTIIEKGLVDITILEAHRYLQYIDLSWNSLSDLSALSGVPYLMHLNVSHNELTAVLKFKPPWNLTFADFSYNQIKRIDDLSAFWSLVHLDLSNNNIKQIEGLQDLRYLNDLNLSSNNIKRFDNLNSPHLEFLNISNNQIASFEEGSDVGMKTMLNLSFLDMSYNNLTTLAIFKGVYFIKTCHVGQNEVEDLLDIGFMKSMHMVADLDLTDNPLTQWPKYREVVIHTLPSLSTLDNMTVQTQEKISTAYMFDPDARVTAASDHARLLLIEGLTEPSLGLDVLPVDQGPFPLVVLVGPPACMKGDLLDKMIQTLGSERIYRGVHHISRVKKPQEVDGREYHFVTQDRFNELTRSGTFLAVTEIMGIAYGFSRTELAKAVKERKLLVTSMDLKGALTLKACGVSPRLVLVLTESEQLHTERLRAKHVEADKHPSSTNYVASLAEELPLIKEDLSNVSGEYNPDGYSFEEKQLSTESNTISSKAFISFKSNSLEYASQKESAMSNVPFPYPADASASELRMLANIHMSTRTCSETRTTSIATTLSAPVSMLRDSTQTFTQAESDVNPASFVTLERNPSGSFSTQLGKGCANTDGKISATNMDESDSNMTTETFDTMRMSNSTVDNLHTKTSLKSRDTYLDTHLENPGLFSEAIYTDNMDTALHRLCRFVTETFVSHPSQYPLFEPENDLAYQTLIPRRVEQFLEDIYTEHSISEKQIEQSKKYVPAKVLPPRTPVNIGEKLNKTQKCSAKLKCKLH